MPKHTTVYYTLKVERRGMSGQVNERIIDKFVQELQAEPLKDVFMEVAVEGHDYLPVTETID